MKTRPTLTVILCVCSQCKCISINIYLSLLRGFQSHCLVGILNVTSRLEDDGLHSNFLILCVKHFVVVGACQ